MDKNKHKLYKAQILSLIIKDKELLMQGLGEVLNDTKSKTFVKNKLIDETSAALELLSAFPLIANQDN